MARAWLLALALGCAFSAFADDQTPPAGAPGASPAPAPAAPAKAKKPAKAPKASRPAWTELTPAQQQVLAPLQPDWDTLEAERKRKWIGIAKRYPKMKPEEQERVHRRMQAWAKLTPEQRRQARENYRAISKVKQENKNKKKTLAQQWADYQALPPEERAKVQAPPEPPPASKKNKK